MIEEAIEAEKLRREAAAKAAAAIYIVDHQNQVNRLKAEIERIEASTQKVIDSDFTDPEVQKQWVGDPHAAGTINTRRI